MVGNSNVVGMRTCDVGMRLAPRSELRVLVTNIITMVTIECLCVVAIVGIEVTIETTECST